MRLRKTLRLPREHGAWVMIYVPFVIGTLAGTKGSYQPLPVALLLLTITFLFVARQSMFDWVIARGRGINDIEARRAMVVYLGLSGLFGSAVVLGYHRELLAAIASVTVLLLGFNLLQASRRKDRTVVSETIGILGLTITAPASYYLCRGEWNGEAWLLWLLCFLFFSNSVFYVKLRVHSLNRKTTEMKTRSWRLCAVYQLFLLLTLIAMVLSGTTNSWITAAFVPVLTRSMWQLGSPATKISLKRIGILEIIYSFLFLVLVTIGLR